MPGAPSSFWFLSQRPVQQEEPLAIPMRPCNAEEFPFLGVSLCSLFPGQGEFDVIPPKGTLLPNCAQKVQIDFVSSALSDLTSLQMLWLVERAVLARSDVSEV